MVSAHIMFRGIPPLARLSSRSSWLLGLDAREAPGAYRNGNVKEDESTDDLFSTEGDTSEQGG